MLRTVRALVALAAGLAVLQAPAEAEPQPNLLARKQAALRGEWPADAVPGSLLVTAVDEAGADLVLAAHGGTRLSDRVVLLEVAPGSEADVAAEVATLRPVVAVEPDVERSLADVPDDPLFPEQWSHTVADASDAWDVTIGSGDIEIAIVDTGIDATHGDLRGNVIEQVDVSSGRVIDRGIVGFDNDSCRIGHGTFVAGVAAAVGNNGQGITGVSWDASLVDIALTSPASRCGILDSAIILALDHAAGRGSDVVNLSLGGVTDACPTGIQAAVDSARAAGTAVVAAAGNEEFRLPGASSVPASCNGVISVGAVGDDRNIAEYSQQNDEIDLVAPGGDLATGDGILSTALGGGYAEEEGTSFAAPYVAGTIALLRTLEPSLSVDDVEFFLESTATDRGATGRDDAYGWGIVDAAAAVQSVSLGNDPEEPAPDPSFPVSDRGRGVTRIAASNLPTSAVSQAAAMSSETFEPGSALHAVIARSDDFADALAGSALGFGVGPVLFSGSTGPLPDATRAELERALPRGGRIYVLGGSAALPPALDDELRALGYEVVRVAGTTRELTAVAAAGQLARFLADEDFEDPRVALVATGYNWPDAVTAGSFGALFGMPILVTHPETLHAGVSQYLASRSWDRVYVIGGTAAISDATRVAIADAAGLALTDVPRLAGTTRSGTAVAVANELEDTTQRAFGILPQEAYAVNLRHPDGYAHALSTSARLGQRSGVFIPVEGEGGTAIAAEAQSYACRFPVAGIVVGGHDLVAAATAQLFGDLLNGSAPACSE